MFNQKAKEWPLKLIPILVTLISWTTCQAPTYPRSAVVAQTALPTVTVRGFLNFRTTVDGTVIIFTPASAASSESSAKTVDKMPTIETTQSPQTIINTKSSVYHQITPTNVPQNIEPTKPVQQYPTGLVTILGGTVVRNGETTVHETKVIGTYIDGKYAQILQSTARIESPIMQTPTIRPTQTHKSNGPSIIVESPLRKAYAVTKNEEPVVETKTPESDDNGIQNFRKPEPRRLHPRLALNPLRSRWTQSNLKTNQEKTDGNDNKVKKARLGTRRFTLPPRSSPKVRLNRFKAKLPVTDREERQSYNSRIQTQQEPQNAETSESKTDEEKDSDLSLKDTNIDVTPQESKSVEQDITSEGNIDPTKVVKEVQTITSEVTQHVDGNHIQVQTLTLTTTIQRTLHPQEFDTEVIAPTIPVEANDVDATSVQETPPLVISRTYSVTERSMRTTVVPVFDGTVTTSHTVTESFFIRKLITAYKTLPPGDMFLLETAGMSGNYSFNTDLSAAEQSLDPSPYEGSIEITEEPNNELPTQTLQSISVPTIDPSLNMPFIQNNQLPQIDMNNPLFLAAALQNPQLAAMYLGLQQYKQQQQQQVTQYSTVTQPTTYVTTDTVYNTKVVSFYDGRSTRSRTIVEPAGTTERTVATFTTQVVPVFSPNLALQQAQFNNVFASQLVAPQLQMTPQMNTITKTITTSTNAIMTKTKVYTLVYNAFSTRYRTVTSTSIVPTVLTTTITSTVPLQVANTAQPFNIFG
ncbi:uncharacterized protein LOC128952530 [Oppia nitens]|uniref:uncharacterized protein LOC128952530 n=1 Tax=Oppia nitens TaxID=1686743 RepID=UPI0023DA6103|nr:uncharacterized protein LOC128952530 [Oppia nitens]